MLPLDIKYVDSRYDDEKETWKYEDTANPEVPAELVDPVGTRATSEDDWEKFCFVVVRKHTRTDDSRRTKVSIEFVIKSDHLRAALKAVMVNVSGISWVSEPLEVSFLRHRFVEV